MALPTCLQIKRACQLNPGLSCGLLKTITRSYYKEKVPFSYDDHYRGLFDGHNRALNPRRMNPLKEEELLDEVHAIRAKQIDNPSPFHVIIRIKGTMDDRLSWSQKVTLRRLNIHSLANGDVTVVPNTPQFNDMINKVKHLIILKPAVFPNGKLPTEEDIGALRVCPHTGEVTVDEKLRMREKRVNLLPPPLFRGKHLRFKLYKQVGINWNHYMR